MHRLRFIQFANHMLFGAVNALKNDLRKGKKFDEPAYTAAIATKFPAMMNGAWGNVKFGGCFIHKSPIVTLDNTSNPSVRESCEAGDLLVLCRDMVDGYIRINAALFQVKKMDGLYNRIKPDNEIQLKFYTEWPTFSFGRSYKSPYYNIEPKTATPGAQYMFINEKKYYHHWYDYYPLSLQPLLFTHSKSAAVMCSDPDLSFGNFLWEFINWQDGRPISESEQKANDEWSKFIWRLISFSKTKSFMHKNVRISKHIKATGDFFQFMTLPMSETHADVMFTDWLNQHNMSNDTETFNNKMLNEEKFDDEGGDKGFAILFIDKIDSYIDKIDSYIGPDEFS